jgi:hypothetical protein
MIFIHLHKAGGSSVEISLAKTMKWNDLVLGSTELGEIIQPHYFALFGLEKHSSASVVKEVVGHAVWNSYFKWATVRSPYSRVASLYSFTASLVEPLLPSSSFPVNGSVADRTLWIETADQSNEAPWNYPTVRAYLTSFRSDHAFSNYLRSPYLDGEPAFQAQTSQLTDEDGKLIVDEVVKLEELNTVWPAIISRFDAGDVPIVKHNVTPSHWRKQDSELFREEQDVELVRTRFSADFDILAYNPLRCDSVAVSGE